MLNDPEKNKEPKRTIKCPQVIKRYNINMGRIDKNDMLVPMYKIPGQSKRWYWRLITNSVIVGILYKRHTSATIQTKGDNFW